MFPGGNMGSVRRFSYVLAAFVIAATMSMVTSAAAASPVGLISMGGASVIEGGRAAFDITLSEPSSSEVTVQWTTERDTASPAPRDQRRFCNGDYQETHGTAKFKAGVTERRVMVQTCPDVTPEGDEQFWVGLEIGTATGGYDLGPHSRDHGTILDRAPCGCDVQLGVGDASIVEGNAGGHRFLDFTVSLNQVSTSQLAVDYTVASGTASCGAVDRHGNPVDPSTDCGDLNRTRTLVFHVHQSGQTGTSHWIRVPIVADTNVEADETFTVTLSNARNASGALVITRAVGTGTILNDD
jgi:hypothetical protein